MESVSSPGSPSPESSPDFGFAFNDVNFSDRILRIEVLPDSPRSKSDPGDSFAGWARNRKRRRDDQLGDSSEATVQGEEQILNCNMPDLDDGATHENQEEEAVAMIEESALGLEMAAYQTGHEVAQVNETSNSMDHLEARLKTETSSSMDYSAARVKTIHISSPILAAKSPFFYKLFSNGMRESVQRDIILRIQESEEPALMDMLNFMYCNTLRSMTPPALLDVLMAADKYEVASCMRYCSRLLRKLPMSCESALLYLDLPSNILMADTVQPLTDAAKQFLAARFKDINKFQEEVLNLPLAGVEAVLFSDDLQVASEDAVYDFVMKWAKTHYPKPEERREILSTRLLRFVRFPCMTCRKLKKVLMSSDIDTELASKVVLDALFFKAEAPYRQRSLIAEEPNNTFRRFVERAYKYRPVKVVEFESPRQQCIVYLDLKREECANLFMGGRVYSQAFHLGGQGFFLSGHCNMDQQSSFHCFGLFLGMQEKGSVAFTVDYEFASRTKLSEEFVSKYKGSYTFTGGKAVGYRNLFGVPSWTAFIDDDSPYFINDVLHLKAELTIKK